MSRVLYKRFEKFKAFKRRQIWENCGSIALRVCGCSRCGLKLARTDYKIRLFVTLLLVAWKEDEEKLISFLFSLLRSFSFISLLLSSENRYACDLSFWHDASCKNSFSLRFSRLAFPRITLQFTILRYISTWKMNTNYTKSEKIKEIKKWKSPNLFKINWKMFFFTRLIRKIVKK